MCHFREKNPLTKRRKRTDEQKREIKRAMEQYDILSIQQLKRATRELHRAALNEEEEPTKQNDDNKSEIEYVRREDAELPLYTREFDNRSFASFDSFASK